MSEVSKLLASAKFRLYGSPVGSGDKSPACRVNVWGSNVGFAVNTNCEQDPDPNTNVKLNRTIYLTVITRLSPIVRFPELSNKTYLEAEATLSNFGLKVGDTTYVSDVAKDVVLQFLFRGRALQAGDEIPKGSIVNLVLGDGLGTSEVDIPDLVGLTLDEARMALSGSSLKIGIISFQGSSRDTLNLKISKQSPALSDSLSKVPIGSRVDLVLGGN